MDFSTRIPHYLQTKENTIKLVVLTAIFSLAFINIFEPFNSRAWLPDMSDTKYFILSTILVLLGMTVVAISRVILYKKFGSRSRRLHLWQYLLWIAAEILAMAFTFSIFEITAIKDPRPWGLLLHIALRNTALVLLLPYSILWLYFSWDDKNKRLLRMSCGNSQTDNAGGQTVMTSFFDSKGEIKFSVKLSDLLYIKGADNYITVHYTDGQKMQTVIIRNTMKQAEADLHKQGIIRCHKSYMVNVQHIKTIERKGGQITARLNGPIPIDIPVTKSYINEISEIL